MKRSSYLLRTSVLGAVLLAAACAASTKIVSSWKEPSFQEGSVKKVYVVGVSRNMALRRMFEDGFVSSLVGLKLQAEPSYKSFPEMDLTKVDKDATVKTLLGQGFTHVLVSRLVDQKTVETYVPGTVVVGGYGPAYPGYYGGWYPYMSTAYVASPGYVTSNEVYGIETNLYALLTEGVAWSGVTQTTLSSTAEAEVNNFIKTIVYEMRSKRVI